MAKLVIDPVTRIEGHLRIEAVVEDGQVKEARASGTMFRGFEILLKGRDPRDAQQITQRVCGVCPMAHGVASARCLDAAFGVADQIPKNGRILRDLLLGSNFIQSHVLHFYHLAAIDYVDVAAAAAYQGSDSGLQTLRDFIGRGALHPFVPRYEGDYRLDRKRNLAAASNYLEALRIRRIAHEMIALLAGKMPHCCIVPGGVAWRPTEDKMAAFLWRLNECRKFIDNCYVPDVVTIAQAYPDYLTTGRGCGSYLSYGWVGQADGAEAAPENMLLSPGLAQEKLDYQGLDLEQITEEVQHSWYDGQVRHPSQGATQPDPDKEAGYSWLKSPRYQGRPCEVGPLARWMVSYTAGNKAVQDMLNPYLEALGVSAAQLPSVAGRHLARALEAKLVADAMAGWLLQLDVDETAAADVALPDSAEGVGTTAAPRGALGHWIQIGDGKIENYQLVVPTTWNAGPTDSAGNPGPIEQALVGASVKDEDNPFEIVRIVRSFDPCLACAVHLIDRRANNKKVLRVV